MSDPAAARIHPTAIIEEGVLIGDGTQVWDNVHIRHGARLGDECIVGEKSYIAYDVPVGNRCKIGPFVNICAGVSLGDGVMIAIGVIFTNELFPRATTPDLLHLQTSDPTEATLRTVVSDGVTIGANATIRGGVTIGQWAMVGMASTVTKNVKAFHLVAGSPARVIGAVCRCGEPVYRFPPLPAERIEAGCGRCERRYSIQGDDVAEL